MKTPSISVLLACAGACTSYDGYFLMEPDAGVDSGRQPARDAALSDARDAGLDVSFEADTSDDSGPNGDATFDTGADVEVELDRARIRALLSTCGIPADAVDFFPDDTVLIEGDVLLSIDHFAADATAGRGACGLPSVTYDAPVWVGPEHPDAAVSPYWRTVFVYAGADWNDQAGTQLRADAPGEGGRIQVVYGSLPDCKPGVLDWTHDAMVPRIVLNSAYACQPDASATGCALTTAERVEAGLEGLPGTVALQVAAHLFGHALGLSHSHSEEPSVMAPGCYGDAAQVSERLTPVDVARYQALAGGATN
ncbi:MAG TPA: matrixin family metalloprotease [Polyangiaceae bacterium]